jgi:hypothetical protein
MIGVDGAAYPGVAFRLADVRNFELAYPVPHVSGQWDAIQYDPVFQGSNTWQVYHGPAYQRAAEIPTGRWFHLRVDFCGERAAISVDGQPPLVVERLARPAREGLLGLWTYLPAHFCDLRVAPCDGGEIPTGEAPSAPAGAVGAWFVEGYGVAACEPNGVLNLNRCLPASLKEAWLVRRFEMDAAGEVLLHFGFSDALALELDGQAVFQGENTFKGFADRAARGYVDGDAHVLVLAVDAGPHMLAAALEAKEPFGWGLSLAARGDGLRWLPPEGSQAGLDSV